MVRAHNGGKAHAVRRKMYRNRYAYFLLLPIIAFFVIFHYVPIYGVQLAFKDYVIRKGISGSPWAGLKYFSRLFASQMFLNTLRNTILISVYRIAFGFPAPILFALLLNEITHVRYKRMVQTISYMPHFISWVILGGIITELLSPTRGAVNALIVALGGESVHFMAETKYFRSILVITGIWKEVGWSSVIYLAAISGISTEQYESASIDGATRIQMIRHITLPSILSVISIQFILSMGGILNAGFDQVFNLYNPIVYSVGDIIDTYAYRIGLSGKLEYSLSTAIGLFKNVIGFALVYGTNMVVRRLGEGEHGIW